MLVKVSDPKKLIELVIENSRDQVIFEIWVSQLGINLQ